MTSMSSPVEAGSLASITAIAAQPPLHSSEVSNQHLDSLTLYITRVPGRRDVFLTPLKPRDRVVTAQDIQSALYYVHVNTSEDIELHHHAAAQEETAEVASELPPRTSLMVETSFITQVPPLLPLRPNQVPRKPVLSDVTNAQQMVLPRLPPRPLPALPSDDHDPYMNKAHSGAQQTSGLDQPLQHDDLEGSLTLIRREPATAAQWNVATICDTPVPLLPMRSFGTTAPYRIKKGGAPIDIIITNPAYFLFETPPSNGDAQSERSSGEYSASGRSFRRRLHLPRDHFTAIPGGLRQDMRKSGYCFRSPWGGTCEFTTSTTGRALVCKHALQHQHPCEVSELRFNLPPSTTDASSAASQDQRRQSYLSGNKRHSKMEAFRSFAHMGAHDIHFRAQTEISSNDNDIDLSLGSELAGGGFGGRQPKLGKLIVHPGGLAMLDLLVAANIGLWWRAWEKIS